ncbi:MAG: 16S rRNA (guanine(527)-N(7))-methyltransferase RsmG [Ginsengibacter sp.]
MDIIRKYFPDLTSKQIEQYAALKNLYADWNEKINVISRKDMDNFYEHHVLHSLAIAKIFSFPDAHKVMDLGSGGGFPGIPLAIFFPGVNFYLVDSIKKKMKVAGEIAKAIELTNVTTQHIRAEEIHGQQFDVVISRAVAPLKDLCKWSEPVIKKSKVESQNAAGLICLKGGNLNSEIVESGCRPGIYCIDKLFEEEFFQEKYILYISKF